MNIKFSNFSTYYLYNFENNFNWLFGSTVAQVFQMIFLRQIIISKSYVHVRTCNCGKLRSSWEVSGVR